MGVVWGQGVFGGSGVGGGGYEVGGSALTQACGCYSSLRHLVPVGRRRDKVCFSSRAGRSGCSWSSSRASRPVLLETFLLQTASTPGDGWGLLQWVGVGVRG